MLVCWKRDSQCPLRLSRMGLTGAPLRLNLVVACDEGHDGEEQPQSRSTLPGDSPWRVHVEFTWHEP